MSDKFMGFLDSIKSTENSALLESVRVQYMAITESAGHTYPLTLTQDEQKAFDFVGYRYPHGDEMADLIRGTNRSDDDIEWGKGTITFDIPENVAWSMQQLLADEDTGEYDYSFALFAPALKEKMVEFFDSIV